MMLAGEPAAPGLSGAFPTVASVALAFRALGVGVSQGRLVQVLFTAGALEALCLLALELYGRKVAMATAGVAILMSTHLEINPIHMGRQVLAEPAMLFFALAGYGFLLLSFKRSLLFLLPASLFWGVAIISKAQLLPFWIASLALSLLAATVKRHSREGLVLAAALAGSYFASKAVLFGEDLLLKGHTVASQPLPELYQIAAFVPLLSARQLALAVACIIGLPSLLGLSYVAHSELKRIRLTWPDPAREVVKISLWSFTASWFAWYVVLSSGWIRYLFPATFVASLFLAVMLHDLTDGFNLRSVVQRVAAMERRRRPDHAAIGALGALVLIGVTVPVTVGQLARLSRSDSSAAQTAAWLNANTRPDALIESYESELFFFLNRPYHFPPDPTSISMARRVEFKQAVTVSYDALVANPDYIVVGSYGASAGLYDPALEGGSFRLVNRIGAYEIYARAR